MALISNSIKLARRQPFGCLFSTLLALLFISGAAAAIAFSVYSLAAVGLLKNTLQNQTGFYVGSDSIFVNLYTGKCTIGRLRIDNPTIYTSREYFEKSGDPAKSFLLAKSVSFKLSPLKLLAGELEISELEMDIMQLNCVRLNNSTYNLAEFLNNVKKIISFQKFDGEPTLKLINLKIDNVSYRDLSSLVDVIKSDSNANINFSRQNVTDFPKLLDSLKKLFDEKKLSYLTRGFSTLEATN